MKKEKTSLTKRDIRKILQDESIKIYSDNTSYNYGKEEGELNEAGRRRLLNLIDYNCFWSKDLNSFNDTDTTYTIVRVNNKPLKLGGKNDLSKM